MSFVYDPATQVCVDSDAGVTVRFGGSGRSEDEFIAQEFIAEHRDWTCSVRYLYEELDISHIFAFGDLRKNEVAVETTYGPNPRIRFVGSWGPATQVGKLPPGPVLRRIFHDGLTCLLSCGSRKPIRVSGILKPREAKAVNA